MLTKINKFAKSLVHKTPFLLHLFLRRQFQVEMQLMDGAHKNENTHPSIIHFSLNKAATQHTKKVLRRCAIENGMTPAHLNEYAFYTKYPYLTGVDIEKMKKYQHVFKPQGYLYTAFGGIVQGIPDLEKYKVILMVRDPRDLVVSSYYSISYSHSTPPKTSSYYERFSQRRQAATKMTIDEYAISESERFYTILHRYKILLLDNYPHVYLTSYEKMTSDYQVWLKALLNACDLTVSDELFQLLIEENQRLQPKKEDIHKHIRKGKPGDYKDKLKPETIEYLNKKFAPIFEAFAEVWDLN
ncbi:MAG: hypothetical protein DRI56_08145 [Chloroflexota bacterium]|nr:MAG: hypothetical protein DRI56_08145 [Chloroflexota bacterium]